MHRCANLAAYFAAQKPVASQSGEADAQKVAAGKSASEVHHCTSCHAPGLVGQEHIPRLAGQLYPYMIKTLSNWDKERGRNPTVPDAAAIMSPVAHSLNRSQIEAVAAFVSTLR